MKRERILLIGDPGTGKTEQLVNTVNYLSLLGKKVYVMDLEDKFEAGMGEGIKPPLNLELFVATDWDTLKELQNKLAKKVRPDEWVLIDGVDKVWAFVRDWFAIRKYNESLAEKLVEVSADMKKRSMFTPVFDQGEWEPIKGQYSTVISDILYKWQVNLVMTAGVEKERGVFRSYGSMTPYSPRGEKNLGHQVNSAFLLDFEQEGHRIIYYITTAKDIKGRAYIEQQPIKDFALEYLSKYITV